MHILCGFMCQVFAASKHGRLTVLLSMDVATTQGIFLLFVALVITVYNRQSKSLISKETIKMIKI